RAALAEGARGADRAAHRLHQLADDRQAQTGPTARPVPGLVAPVEPIEDPGELLRRDAAAGVLDGDLNQVVAARGSKRDDAALGGVAQGVADQVAENLDDPLAVAPRRRQVGLDLGHDRDLAL